MTLEDVILLAPKNYRKRLENILWNASIESYEELVACNKEFGLKRLSGCGKLGYAILKDVLKQAPIMSGPDQQFIHCDMS